MSDNKYEKTITIILISAVTAAIRECETLMRRLVLIIFLPASHVAIKNLQKLILDLSFSSSQEA